MQVWADERLGRQICVCSTISEQGHIYLSYESYWSFTEGSWISRTVILLSTSWKAVVVTTNGRRQKLTIFMSTVCVRSCTRRYLGCQLAPPKCFDTRNRTLGHVIRSSSADSAKPRICSLVPRPFSLCQTGSHLQLSVLKVLWNGSWTFPPTFFNSVPFFNTQTWLVN